MIATPAWMPAAITAHGADHLLSLSSSALARLLGVSDRAADKLQAYCLGLRAMAAASPTPATAAPVGRSVAVPDPTGLRRYEVIDTPDKGRVYLVPLALKRGGQPILKRVSADTHREILERYSRWTSKAEGITPLADWLNWEPKEVESYLRQIDVTHWTCPIPAEDLMADGDLSEHADNIIAARRRALWKETQVRGQKSLERDAAKWASLEISLREIIAEVTPAAPTAPPPAPLDLPPAAAPWAPLICLADVHVGKSGPVEVCGERGASLEHTRRDLRTAFADLVQQLHHRGRPERVLLTFHGDYFNADNAQGTTTAGTPQTMDGGPARWLSEGIFLGREVIEDARRLGAPVSVYVVPGNHDYYTLLAAGYAWQAMYPEGSGVQVHVCTSPRTYVRYGQTLLAFAHGDRIKEDDLLRCVPIEAPAMWAATRERLVLIGHYHHQKERSGAQRRRDGRLFRDAGGLSFAPAVASVPPFVLLQEPSISREDPWHVAAGYVGSRPGLVAHLLERDRGRVGYLIGRPEGV